MVAARAEGRRGIGGGGGGGGGGKVKQGGAFLFTSVTFGVGQSGCRGAAACCSGV